MRRIKVLSVVSLLSGVLLTACGPVDKKESPELKHNALGIVSPFDTLAIPFNVKIAEITVDNYNSNLPVKIIKAKGKHYIVSADRIAGVSRFMGDTTYSITFSDLESSDGELQKGEQKLTFKTMTIVDSDGIVEGTQTKDNNSRSRADILADSTGYFNGAKFTDSISVAGILTGTILTDDDNEDWYKISLKVKDTLIVDLANDGNLKLIFTGPVNSKGEMFDSGISTETSNVNQVLNIAIEPNRAFHGGSDLVNSYQDYYIGVKYLKSDYEKASPYVLKLKILQNSQD